MLEISKSSEHALFRTVCLSLIFTKYCIKIAVNSSKLYGIVLLPDVASTGRDPDPVPAHYDRVLGYRIDCVGRVKGQAADRVRTYCLENRAKIERKGE